MFPSTNDTLTVDQGSNTLKVIIIFIYGLLSFGLILNCIVAGMIVQIFLTLKEALTDKHMFLYVLSLSFVDCLVLANLPLIMVDILMDQWIFGTVICKLHWTVDSVNKILSTFILTLLSFDRYLAVCHPHRLTKWRTIKTTSFVLITSMIFSMCLLSPSYIHAQVRNVKIAEINMTLSKCSYRWNQRYDTMYVYSLFVLGYCIPFTLMTYFHRNISRTLNETSQRLNRFRRRLESHSGYQDVGRHVGRHMLFVAIFYFVCWTPYWSLTLFIQHRNGEDDKWGPPLFLAVHFLVYANSAINPLIYGVSNLEIRRQRIKALAFKRRRSSAAENELRAFVLK